MEKAIEEEKRKKVELIEIWTKTEVDPKLKELERCKAEQAHLLDLPMVQFAKQAPQIKKKIKERAIIEVAEFKESRDGLYATGEFACKSYRKQ